MDFENMTHLEAYNWLYQIFRDYTTNKLAWYEVSAALKDAQRLQVRFENPNDDTIWE